MTSGLSLPSGCTCRSCLDNACAVLCLSSHILSHLPDPIAQPVSLHRKYKSGNLFQSCSSTKKSPSVPILKFVWIRIDFGKDAHLCDETIMKRQLKCALWSSRVWVQASEPFVTFFAQGSKDLQIGAQYLPTSFIFLILSFPSLCTGRVCGFKHDGLHICS